MYAWYTLRAQKRDTDADCHVFSVLLKIKPSRYGSRSLKDITLVCLNFLWKNELKSQVGNEYIAVKKNVERLNHLPQLVSSKQAIKLGFKSNLFNSKIYMYQFAIPHCPSLRKIFLFFKLNQTGNLTIFNIEWLSKIINQTVLYLYHLIAPHNSPTERKPSRK